MKTIMSKLPEAVIEAVHVYATDPQAEACARRVINALAEKLPESAAEKAAFAFCQSGKFECGQGRCAPICMEFMGHKPKECGHALRVHGPLARAAIIAALKDVVEGK